MTAISSVIVAAVSIFFVMSSLCYPNVYKGVMIQGVDLSGYSREEVARLLLAWQTKQHKKSIVLYYGETVFRVDAVSIDFAIDSNHALDTAWNYGRDGYWWERIRKIRAAEKEGYNISLGVKYNEVKLNQLIKQWQEAIERPPQNATLSIAEGGLVPQQQGCKLEVDATRSLVLQAFLESDNSSVALPVTTLYPEVAEDDVARGGMHTALGLYTTKFDKQEANRTENIKLAAWKVNGYILYPGKTFSFNEIVGPREKTYGFKEALEIVNGSFILGVGGGVCQLSSTLYNAVILANLKITERYNHSKPLSYVPLGRDATVVFGVLDFKFTNDTNAPLLIMAEVKDNKLMVGIFGQRPIKETVEIISTEQERIPPEIIKNNDGNMYLGETKLNKQGKPGSVVTTMRVVRVAGKEVKREVLSRDRYLPDNTIMDVGTQMPPFAR